MKQRRVIWKNALAKWNGVGTCLSFEVDFGLFVNFTACPCPFLSLILMVKARGKRQMSFYFAKLFNLLHHWVSISHLFSYILVSKILILNDLYA